MMCPLLVLSSQTLNNKLDDRRSRMAWRTGADLFADMWPLIAARVKPDDFRREFTERLLAYFLEYDVDPADLAGLHPEVDQALARLDVLDGE